MTKRETNFAYLIVPIVIGVIAMCGMLAASATANPAKGVALSDAGEATWVGGASSSSLGSQLLNAGDMNEDGIQDLVAREAVSSRGAWVLYTNPGRQHAKNLADLSPSDGYRMRTANVNPNIHTVGDQNNDGTPDFVITTSAGTWVIYGVADPESELPKCEPAESAETRCLDVEVPQSTAGDRLGYQVESGESGDAFAAGEAVTAGNFSGDELPELAVSARNAAGQGAVYVLRNNLGDTCPTTPGACTVTLSGLSAPNVIRIDGPAAGSFFGLSISNGRDLNQDGRDDLLVSSPAGASQASIYVIYGRNWESSPVSTAVMSPDEGFIYTAAFGTIYFTPGSAGDANGDGRTDIASMLINPSLAAPAMTVAYTSATTPSSPVEIFPSPQPDLGYSIEPTEDDGFGSGSRVQSIGDLNSDGFDDVIAGNQLAPVDGLNRAGWAMIVFGQGPNPSSPLTLGPDLPGSSGIAVLGDVENQRSGEGVAPLGDIDGDDIPDFALSATRDAGGAGTIYLIRGRTLVGGANTGIAGSVSDTAATISGIASPHGRESSAYFEWGETDGYGQQTTAESIGGGNGNVSLQADLSGLQEETEYHYRVVVENDFGVRSYGVDRIFKTADAPVDRCEQDDTLPGCSGYTGEKFCQANPTDPVCQRGSNGAKFCEANPADPICQPDLKSPGLSDLIANSRPAKVRRGKKAVVWAWITSTGTASAEDVKVCAQAPKRKATIVGKRCRKIGNLAPGKTAKVKVKVRMKRKVRKGARVKVKLVASAQGVRNKKTARVRFTVR